MQSRRVPWSGSRRQRQDYTRSRTDYFRAESHNEIYEAGLDAILRVLRCDRASILLFDDSNVMRFVASRSLSDEYCRAVEGHSPWKPDDQFAAPICIDDIENAGDISEELKVRRDS